MDYDIINQVYEEIINIVNDYVRKTNCEYEVARKLSFVLLGYYLVFGPEIFSKLNILLDSIRIYECTSEEEYRNKAIEIAPRIEEIKDTLKYNPITIWDYKYNTDKKFLGGIPNVVYMKEKTIDNVLSIAHEMSHGLEGVSATIELEDEESVQISQGFSHLTVNKETNRFRTDDAGFIELVTSALESRILKSLLSLDEKHITSPLLKEFLIEIRHYKGKNVMSRSYETLSTIFKDLMDNDAFYNLVKSYFYENAETEFKECYESYDSRLNFKALKLAAEQLAKNGTDISNTMYYGEIVRKQADIFSKATNFEPDKKLLILV